MAKRKQTTGLPKKSSSAVMPDETGALQHKPRAQREAELQRYILLGTGAAVAIIVVILLIAVGLELFVNPNRTVLTVNNDTVSVAEFKDRVRLERAFLNTRINNFVQLVNAQGMDVNSFVGQEPLSGWLSQINLPDQLGNSVLSTMIEDKLIRQKAAELNITVSQDDIEKQITQFLGYDLTPPTEETETEAESTEEPTVTPTPFVSPTPSPVPTNTPTLEPTEEATAEATEEGEAPTATFTPVPATSTPTYEELLEDRDETRDLLYQNLTSSANISNEQLTAYFESQALREALKNQVSELTNEVPHVNSRHILVNTEEEALDIIAALEAGESFRDLAAAASLDTGSGANGGELGWAAVTNYVKPFGDAAAEAEIGAIIGPVQSQFGWHIIQIHAREIREITDDELNTARETEFSTWLEAYRAENEANISISDIWVDNVPSEPAFYLAG